MRAYAVPLLALFACALGAGAAGHQASGHDPAMRAVASLLLAMAEAAWTCGVATLLVACRPQWLATWSDTLYFGSAPQRRGPA